MFTVVYRIKTPVYGEEEYEHGEEQDSDYGSEFQEYIIVDLELVG